MSVKSKAEELIECPERIILAGDMALHWGVAIGSTTQGYVDSLAFDVSKIRKINGVGAATHETATMIVNWASQYCEIIDVVAYENPTPMSHSSNLAQDAMIVALLMAAHQLGAEPKPRTYYPSNLKKRATGNGLANKPQMMAAAKEWTGYDFTNDNEADAVCLLRCALEDEHTQQATSILKVLNA